MKRKSIIKSTVVGIAFCGLSVTACNEPQTTMSEPETQLLTSIFPKGNPGSTEYFTGSAWNYGLVPNDSILTTLVGNVYFEPGARSNWHSHPAGQILVITDGVGYHQIEGQPRETIKKGDVVTCPPDTRHWHGASAETGLQQIYRAKYREGYCGMDGGGIG